MVSPANTPPAVDDLTTVHQIAPSSDDAGGAVLVDGLDPGRYLLVEDAAHALAADVTHLGRGMTADLRLDDHTVSARHAIVVARADRVRILDDRSTNGTVVNGRRVEQADLHDGDVVVLGRVVLTYRELR